MENKLQITSEGLIELKKELEERLGKVRDDIAEEIKTAREQGDLSENSAYKAAMDKKEFNEKRIVDIENMLKIAEVISVKKYDNKVGIGEKVKIKNITDGSVMEIELVGASEADPGKKKISVESPLGIALMNKKKGQKFKLQTPKGSFDYIIEEIN